MTFINICVGFVICLIIVFATGAMGAIMEHLSGANDEEWVFSSWFISAIGFGICLTILLYQNGII